MADLRDLPLVANTVEVVTAHGLFNVLAPATLAAVASELADGRPALTFYPAAVLRRLFEGAGAVGGTSVGQTNYSVWKVKRRWKVSESGSLSKPLSDGIIDRIRVTRAPSSVASKGSV